MTITGPYADLNIPTYKGLTELVPDDEVHFCTQHPWLFNDPTLAPYRAADNPPSYRKRMEAMVPHEPKKDNFSLIKSIKTCPGINDYHSLGYIIPLHVDLVFERVDAKGRAAADGEFYNVSTPDTRYSAGIDKIADHHALSQVEGTPLEPSNGDWTPRELIKPISPWFVRLPEGWDMLVLDPLYWMRTPSPLEIVQGRFETEWWTQFHTPCTWRNGAPPNDRGFVVRAGTPLAHVVPVRRADINRPPKIKFHYITPQVALEMHTALNTDKAPFRRQQAGRKRQGGCPIKAAVERQAANGGIEPKTEAERDAAIKSYG